MSGVPTTLTLFPIRVKKCRSVLQHNLKNKKIVLNQSLLSKKDVLDFEYESKSKVFYNMPPLDEREKDIYALNAFLVRLGFVRQQTAEETTKKNKLFGIF